MTWTKLDDTFADHPKVIRAGTRAIGLYVTALVWANRQGTNGIVPKDAIRRLTDEARPNTIAKRLVEAGLWHEVQGGYRIHDFADYQPKREERVEQRSRLSEVRAEAGRRGALRREENRKKTLAEGDHALRRDVSENSEASRDESCSESAENTNTICEWERASFSDAKHAINYEKNSKQPLPSDMQTGCKIDMQNGCKLEAPIPIPFVKPPHPPRGAREPDEATQPHPPDELLPVSAEPQPPFPPVSEGGEDGAPEREQPPPCESGTFAVARKRPENASNEAGGYSGIIETVPPLPAPSAAPQSGCGKLLRPREVRLLEAPYYATAYAEGIGQAKAEKGEDPRYVMPHRAQMTLDDAIDGHAPVQRSQDRVKWLRKAAYLFALHAVGPREQGKLSSYDPGAFLAWANSGALTRVAEAEMAKRRRAERARLPERPPEPTEEEHLRGCIARNRIILEKQANGGVRIAKPADLEAQIAQWEARLAELHANGGANHANGGASHANGGANHANGGANHANGGANHANGEVAPEPLAAGAEGGLRG